jgi:hypothetical protein
MATQIFILSIAFLYVKPIGIGFTLALGMGRIQRTQGKKIPYLVLDMRQGLLISRSRDVEPWKKDCNFIQSFFQDSKLISKNSYTIYHIQFLSRLCGIY